MSVCVTAMFSHNQRSFSKRVVEDIAQAVSAGSAVPRWLQHPELESPEEEFTAEGTVSFFLPASYSIGYGKNLLNLKHTDRWSTFLINRTARDRMLTACTHVARLLHAGDILLLPEGTVLMDKFYDGADLQEIVRAASMQFGPPDLDVRRVYTEADVLGMSQDRVHYFLTNTSAF